MKNATIIYDECGEGKFFAQAFTQLHNGEKITW